MSDVSRYNGPRGENSEPAVPARLTDLLLQLEGTRDYWDRPPDMSAQTSAGHMAQDERAQANSFYRLGTKALRRGELAAAADWLGQAAEYSHPGALFRLAVVVYRQFGDEGRDDARFLIAEAARHGHGDAKALLQEATIGLEADVGPPNTAAQDPEFASDVRAALGLLPTTPTSQEALPALPPLPIGLQGIAAGQEGKGTTVAFKGLVTDPRHGARDRSDPADTTRPATDAGCGPGSPLTHDGVSGVGATQAVMEESSSTTVAATERHQAANPAGAEALDHKIGQPTWLDTPTQAPAGFLWVPSPARLWTPSPLRSPSVMDLAQQVSSTQEPAQRWQHAMRVLDVLHAIGAENQPMSAEQIARTTGMDPAPLNRLLAWLSEQGLVAAAEPGAYMAGPLMRMLATHEGAEREYALRKVLGELRDEIGAAVYVSRYVDGEVRISEAATGPSTPAVDEWVDFREAAHASAVGKSLLAQLDFEGRMDHLSRRRPVPLTSRTITDHQRLFHALDHHGPQAAQFDLLEYSNDQVCAAFPLAIAGQAACVALSLPIAQQHRLLTAANILSHQSASLLTTLLLLADQPTPPSDHSATQSNHTGAANAHDAEALARTGPSPLSECRAEDNSLVRD